MFHYCHSVWLSHLVESCWWWVVYHVTVTVRMVTTKWLNTLLSSCDNVIWSCCYLSSHMFWVLWYVRMWVCCICVGICMHAMYESHYSAIYVNSESQNVQNVPLYGNPAINTQCSIQGILPTGMTLVVVLGGWVSKMGTVMYCQRWVYVLCTCMNRLHLRPVLWLHRSRCYMPIQLDCMPVGSPSPGYYVQLELLRFMQGSVSTPTPG